MPGLAETLATDWSRAARFYARLEITEAMSCHGVVSGSVRSGLADLVRGPNPLPEAKEHAQAVLPSLEAA